MADVSSAWAARPSDLTELSSDEDDFVSSQSTASVEPETLMKQHLSTTLRLDQLDSSHSSTTRRNTPGSETSSGTPSNHTLSKKSLQLLDLPLDVLKDIIKEVTPTSDLTSLALTCSALHSLIIPHMYSRFDIVWPESLDSSTEDYSGVDALSYGLSTLVMGEDVFHQLPLPRSDRSTNACPHCGCDDRGHHSIPRTPRETGAGFRSRRGNYYGQHTRIFSIGNGPLHWVQEYSVNREVGKMLGTLVALAVARMVNLEAFIWDMPTGVVREIWLALASLANRPGHQCRLERIWVRWHDNSESPVLWGSQAPAATRLLHKYKHVEHPSLSVLPPLKSVTVLDIDESAYVEELAVLIERSRHRLTELRIGIASHAAKSKWLRCGTSSDTAVVTSSEWPRASGVLGILSRGATEEQIQQDDSATVASTAELSMPSDGSADTSPENVSNPSGQEAVSPPSAEPHIPQDPKSPPSACSDMPTNKIPSPVSASEPDVEMLKLEVLELERIPLSVPTLLPAIDWTRLTTLTIMQCDDHEKLWRALRRKYAPPSPRSQDKGKGRRRSSSDSLDFSLNIKHLRTDSVSPYLMLFVKDALAPNTLESVYLHDSARYSSVVQIDAIYRHIFRKHRLSLRKVLVDANGRRTIADLPSSQWYKWMFNHEMVSFVTSGRMPQLKELGMAMYYRDWHYFLQRLPNMPQLHALYLPSISKVNHNMKELALQVLDIVSIRPELNIAYVGLQSKCYQILEANRGDSVSDSDDTHGPPGHTGPDQPDLEWDGEQPGSSGDDDNEDNEESSLGAGHSDLVFSDDDSSWSEGGDTDPDDFGASRVQFQLREILFYDEKISIFKARHGVL